MVQLANLPAILGLGLILRFLKSPRVVIVTTSPSLIDYRELPPLSRVMPNEEVGSRELGLITLVTTRSYPARVYELIVKFGSVNCMYVKFFIRHPDEFPFIVQEEFVKLYDKGKYICIIEFARRMFVLLITNLQSAVQPTL